MDKETIINKFSEGLETENLEGTRNVEAITEAIGELVEVLSEKFLTEEEANAVDTDDDLLDALFTLTAKHVIPGLSNQD